MSHVKEHPILFSAPMVRAILEGRKTVTRRIVKDWQSPKEDVSESDAELRWAALAQCHPRWGFIAHGATAQECADDLASCGVCPYGQRGERLWVRETWSVISHDFDEHGNMIDWTPDRPATPIREMPFGRGYYSGHVIYRADGEAVWAGDDDGGGDDRSAWKPSIHMPRIASRILLEITDVHVERLQDINDSQIESEGVDLDALADRQDRYDMCHAGSGAEGRPTLRTAWRDLWQSINGPGSWDANPWVWVVEFKRVTP
jgi:hypothetical protein